MKLKCDKGWKRRLRGFAAPIAPRPGEEGRGDQDHAKTAPRASQTAPREPKTLLKGFKIAPRSPQDHPRVIDSELCSIIIIFLQNKNFGSSPEAIKEIQEAAKINELLSLHTSEPPGLRVPAANCLGGIREAQTICLGQPIKFNDY